jgi:multiple sugar transport system permease protein
MNSPTPGTPGAAGAPGVLAGAVVASGSADGLVSHADGPDSGTPQGTLPEPARANVRGSRNKHDDGIAGFLFALPHLILFFVFVLAPVCYGFYISLFRWHVLAKNHLFTGLGNYQAALGDDIFWVALRNTVYFVVLVVPMGNLVSLALALGLANVRRLNTFYKIAYYLPVIISIAVVAVLWRWLYNTEIGLLNLYLSQVVGGLRAIGLPLPPFEPIPWLSNPSWTMPSIALMTIWWGAGGNMVLYLAGLSNIPDDYYEAATIDGAGAWQKFRAITWPLLKPTTLFCLVFSVLGAFQIFGQTYVLFAPGSGPARSGLTLALYMYQQGFNQYEIGYGAAIAYLLFALVLILTVIQFRLLSGRDEGAAPRRNRLRRTPQDGQVSEAEATS